MEELTNVLVELGVLRLFKERYDKHWDVGQQGSHKELVDSSLSSHIMEV